MAFCPVDVRGFPLTQVPVMSFSNSLSFSVFSSPPEGFTLLGAAVGGVFFFVSGLGVRCQGLETLTFLCFLF